jgi:hypothetical protein
MQSIKNGEKIMKSFKTCVLLSVFVPLLVVLLSFGGLAQASGAWNVVPSPNPSKTANVFAGVAAVSKNDVWAVGYKGGVNSVGNSTSRVLIEHWNGTRWSVVPTPVVPNSVEDSLSGVAAVSATDVWAVGRYFTDSKALTLIEHWNGTKWSVVANPNPSPTDNFLNGVAAVSKNNVWTVGWYENNSLQRQQVLIEHWNGTKWSMVRSPARNFPFMQLTGLAVLSANDIWGVGDFLTGTQSQAKTLIEHWNGTAWSIVNSPNSSSPVNRLVAAAAVSAKNVWAVGYYSYDSGGITQDKPLIEHWNGNAWSVVFAPGQSRSALTGIAVLSASDIWAVGGHGHFGQPGQTLLEHWNGTAWRIVSSPNPGSADNRLAGVARVPGTSTLWAVGSYASDPNNSLYKTLTLSHS